MRFTTNFSLLLLSCLVQLVSILNATEVYSVYRYPEREPEIHTGTELSNLF